jgi:hypothetical protein
VGGLSQQDTSGPVLTVTSPPGTFARVFDSQFTFSGTANDDTGVTGICYQQDGQPWVTLPPTVDWTCGVTLHPGTNAFLFKAVDLMGNYSVTQNVVLFYSVTQALSLSIVGNGQVVGATHGQGLEIGHDYTVRAVPAADHSFSHWEADGVVSTDPTLHFLMESNLSISAHFMPNPFLTLRGSYVGLFYDTNGPVHETSGLLTFKLTEHGRFSGKLVLGGVSHACSGQFGMDLRAQQTIVRSAPHSPLAVTLQLTAGSDQVTGSIDIGGQTSLLDGYRAVFHSSANPATAFAGKYTLAFSGSDDAAASPQGHGFGAVTVTSAGAVTFKGAAADGTPVTRKAPLAANGQWAFYAPLHKGRGSVFGWLTLADLANSDVSGLLLWTKPAGAGGNFYTNGFVNEVMTIGSRYVAQPSGTSALSFSDATVRLEGGNLAGPVTNEVALSELNKVIVTSTNLNALVLKLSTSSGLMSGSFLHPQSLKKSVIKGALLQRQNAGPGYFLGTNQSGAVFFGQTGDFPLFYPAP